MRALSMAFALVSTGCGLSPCCARSAVDAGAPVPPSFPVESLERHVYFLADDSLEGRASPSPGLEIAARYLADHLQRAGLRAPPGAGEPGAGDKVCLRPFRRQLEVPIAERCKLELLDREEDFPLGVDFVPISGCPGSAAGELVFSGFGIESSEEGFDELDEDALQGAIALLVEGEPDHETLFEGAALSAEASLWRKLTRLRKAGAVGAIVVRRDATRPLAFRHSWALWNGEPVRIAPADCFPAVEVTPKCAARLLGEDVLALAKVVEETGRPLDRPGGPSGRKVAFATALELATAELSNVVGWIAGSDPALAGECVVLGAHYDHIGVDDRGRVGLGADDNASGCAALIEIARELFEARPRRSVLVCAFAAEEDGLLGSEAFVADPPVAREQMVAMINMDMLGRGVRDEVAVLGIDRNPYLGDVLSRAQELSDGGIQKIATRGGAELFQRSDHYSFHKRGIPALFFLEGVPLARNRDYHTWRDVPELVDAHKIANTARLVFHTAWLLANDDRRPPKPRE
jgi:hypothetical protein